MPAEATGLRVLAWNVRDMLGDPLAVVRVIRAAGADAACLQETPRWPGSRGRLAALGRAAGLHFVDGGQSAAGCALLVAPRVQVGPVRAVRLPVRGRLQRPRGTVVAAIRLPAAPWLSLACIHLGLDPAERLDHARRVCGLLAGQARAVIAGDLNEQPGDPAWRALAAAALDPAPAAEATFPAAAPHRRIDAVLASPAVRVTEYDVWRASPADVRLASDHRPVLAVVA